MLYSTKIEYVVLLYHTGIFGARGKMKNVRDFRKIIKMLDFLGCLCYNRRVAVWKPSRRVLGKVLLEGS